MSVVAGIGFRREVSAGEIVALVERALAQAALDPGQLARLATLAGLAQAPSFREAARRLRAEPACVDRALAAAQPAVRTRSERALRAHGVGSVAEAAALAAAGPGATLVLERIASAAATCALARIGGEQL